MISEPAACDRRLYVLVVGGRATFSDWDAFLGVGDVIFGLGKGVGERGFEGDVMARYRTFRKKGMIHRIKVKISMLKRKHKSMMCRMLAETDRLFLTVVSLGLCVKKSMINRIKVKIWMAL